MADLDGDGLGDLLIAGLEGVSWYRALGGAWAPAVPLDAATSFSVAATDVDGDGDLDVVRGETDGGTWGWAENLGGGSFGAMQLVDAVASPTDIVAQDFNGDGWTDVVVYGQLEGIAWRYDGTGVGFGAPVEVATDAWLGRLFLADLDGGGSTDLLVAADDGLVGYPDVVAGPGTWLSLPTQGAMSASVGDVDGDGGAGRGWIGVRPCLLHRGRWR